MGKEEAIYFTNITEVESRCGYDTQCIISLNNFSHLIGPYKFEENEACQFLKPEGICRQPHQNGWLGKTKDGKEGLIGRDCARKYFKADRKFTEERRRVNRSLNIKKSKNTISNILGDDGDFESRVKAEIDRFKSVRKSIRDYKDGLPRNVLRKLQDMAKTGRSEVTLEVQDIGTENSGNPWRNEAVGRINGVEVWLDSFFSDTQRKLHSIKEAIPEIDLKSKDEKELKKWAKYLSEFPACSINNQNIEAITKQFFDLENLTMISLLTRNDGEQINIVGLAIKYGCPQEANDFVIENEWKTFRLAIKNKLGGKNYRFLY
jgi:hypothetical protein